MIKTSLHILLAPLLGMCMALSGTIKPIVEKLSIVQRLWYTHSAINWNEALPLGNGRMGALIFGGVASEKLPLNESTLITAATSFNGYDHSPGLTGKDPSLKATTDLKAVLTKSSAQLLQRHLAD